MILRLFIIFFLLLNSSFAFDSKDNPNLEQQIDDFSLSGFTQNGRKLWDLSGKSAYILEQRIKLKDIVGNFYGEKEAVKLTAKQGEFNKQDSNVHLKDDVVITTSKGARLTTQSLDWDRSNQLVSTKESINIERENVITEALGAFGQSDLKKITLEKDVKVNIKPNPEEKRENPIVITCAGPLQIDYEKNIAIFNKNVKVENNDLSLYSDIMEVYFSEGKTQEDLPQQSEALLGTRIEKIICRGNVKIVRGKNVSYSDEATYLASEKRIILSGAPKLVIYPKENPDESFRD
ncbi:MAG: LPS export ABC transporter periplasmic protein LptC [Candidatus Omnitrophica bacterium]|nr:LPS export ABC transporter periplasmic protein LptC [Candidatus Omnitrophota bacterium]